MWKLFHTTQIIYMKVITLAIHPIPQIGMLATQWYMNLLLIHPIMLHMPRLKISEPPCTPNVILKYNKIIPSTNNNIITAGIYITKLYNIYWQVMQVHNYLVQDIYES